MKGRWRSRTAWIVCIALAALFLQASIGFADFIIDNGAAGTSYTGTWAVSGGTTPYGTNSLWSRNGAKYTWSFSGQVAGWYEAGMWWSGYSTRTTSAAVTITHRDGTSTVTVNQKLNAGQWNSLGQFYFDGAGSVTITAANGSTVSTCADAVRFVYQSGGGVNIPPTAVIDALSPNPAQLGQVVSFTGHGTDTDGTIAAYRWESNIDGILSTASSFSTSPLSVGAHVITLVVQDDAGEWSTGASRNLTVTAVQSSDEEHIYVCLLYFSKTDEPKLVSLLQSMGAVRDGDVWRYTNPSTGKKFVIHSVKGIEGMKQALYTENAHVIVKGHSNYGLGGVFIPDYAYKSQITNNIRYVDDDLIFNYSSPWIGVSVKGMIESQAYPNWWPVFKDGASGIMPYEFGDPRGNPPYNYFITYQVPGDATFYKVETVRNSSRERFPGAAPAWYSPDGSAPDPADPAELQHYITNSAPADPTKTCGTRICPKPHYSSRTILFRKDLDVDVSRMKYTRMLFDTCTVGSYYLDTFQRGVMHYTLASSNGDGTYKYIRAYLEGKSDYELWRILQAHQPIYDYYDFTKRPSEQ